MNIHKVPSTCLFWNNIRNSSISYPAVTMLSGAATNLGTSSESSWIGLSCAFVAWAIPPKSSLLLFYAPFFPPADQRSVLTRSRVAVSEFQARTLSTFLNLMILFHEDVTCILLLAISHLLFLLLLLFSKSLWEYFVTLLNSVQWSTK